MKKISSYLLILLLLVVSQACSDDSEDPNQEVRDAIEQQDSQINTYLTENGIEAEKDDYGVYWVPLEENPSGAEINAGDVADVTYKLTQLDGTLIGENTGDSMRVAFDDNALFVPVSFYHALLHMREGEKFRFYLPFNTAYRNYELKDVVPYRSIVVMDLEVKRVYQTVAEIKAADIEMIEKVISNNEEQIDTALEASGVRKVLLEAGSGEELPDAKDVVGIRYTGRFLDGTIFDTNTGASDNLFTFTIGSETGAIAGMQAGVKTMKEGEKAIIYIPSAEAYGKGYDDVSMFVAPESVREDYKKVESGRYNRYLSIPPHTPLVFEVELVSLAKKD